MTMMELTGDKTQAAIDAKRLSANGENIVHGTSYFGG